MTAMELEEIDMKKAKDSKKGGHSEKRLIAEIAADTVTLQDRRYPKPKTVLRGVHPKSHGCLKGTVTINPDVPEPLQVGLFADPGKCYKAVVRSSNAAATVACDLARRQQGQV